MSSNIDAYFWLVLRPASGKERCIIAGKYPNRLENLKEFEG